MSAAALLDVAYVLKLNEARRHDADMLAAAIARGVDDVDTVAQNLASEGAEALFERVLDEADPEPEIPVDAEPEGATELSEEESRTAITNMLEWAARVNGPR